MANPVGLHWEVHSNTGLIGEAHQCCLESNIRMEAMAT